MIRPTDRCGMIYAVTISALCRDPFTLALWCAAMGMIIGMFWVFE